MLLLLFFAVLHYTVNNTATQKILVVSLPDVGGGEHQSPIGIIWGKAKVTRARAARDRSSLLK